MPGAVALLFMNRAERRPHKTAVLSLTQHTPFLVLNVVLNTVSRAVRWRWFYVQRVSMQLHTGALL
jgi:hypothetical protein